MVLSVLLAAPPAFALQPLSEFLAGAKRASVDNREAALAADVRDSEAASAVGRALPSMSVRGQYTRNEYEVAFNLPANLLPPGLSIPAGPVQPLDAWDAYFQIDVPIVDLATWTRARSARGSARASRIAAEATRLDVEKEVARNYYQLLGAEAVRQSGARSLAASESNHALALERRTAGVATELDVSRAAAEVERARQNVVDAELLVNLTRRALATLTGIQAEVDEASAKAIDLVDDLHEEAPLERWEKTSDGEIPALRAAAEQTSAARTAAHAAQLSLLPTLSASGVEHVTNATAFLSGHNSAYALSLTLGWRLDLATLASIRTARQQAEVAQLEAERTRLRVHDQINDAWQRVHAGIAKSRAARAQAQAAALAAQFANERYENGNGTQLDVVQAQRDAYAAEVARISADADLRFARALLRLAAGHLIDEPHDRTPR